MKSKFSKIILTITIFFLSTESAFGATIHSYVTNIKDSDGNIVSRVFTGGLETQDKIAIGETEATAVNGYCIDVGATLDDKTYINQLEDLEDYLSYILDSSKVKSVANKINQYVQFGYGYNGQNTDKYIVATQKLIWDELYNAGYRQSYYNTDVTFKAHNTGKTYDISSEEKTIQNNINNYYKKPSMCSSTTKLEIAVGETITYEDTNKVLSNYKVTCDNGLTCVIDGNTLKVTATAEGSEHNIKFSKDGLSGNGTIIYRKQNDHQAVLVNAEPIEGVSCQFGLDTYKNVQTSGSKIVATMSLCMLSIMVAYIIITRNQYLNAK